VSLFRGFIFRTGRFVTIRCGAFRIVICRNAARFQIFSFFRNFLFLLGVIIVIDLLVVPVTALRDEV